MLFRSSFAPWREVIHPSKMIVWCRMARHQGGAASIKWTHLPSKQDVTNPPSGTLARNTRRPTDLRNTDLGGLLWQPNTNPRNNKRGGWSLKVGRVWIRMLPVPSKDQPGEMEYSGMQRFPSNGQFMEVFTCFPSLSGPHASRHRQFVSAMDNGGGSGFKRVWGDISP